MNREEAKEVLPLFESTVEAIKAYIAGKPVLYGYGTEWQPIESPNFEITKGSPFHYKPKPEPALRAWTLRDAPAVAMLRRKGNDIEHDSRVIAWHANHGKNGLCRTNDHGVELFMSFEIAHLNFVRIAEDGTEHPCGTLSDAEGGGGAGAKVLAEKARGVL